MFIFSGMIAIFTSVSFFKSFTTLRRNLQKAKKRKNITFQYQNNLRILPKTILKKPSGVNIKPPDTP